ncbi:MAG: efflux RND transporter periplasmic adaptor subunit [Coxiellaceae bacterium]|nr:efflux RND transporter periplasmic adaptor subunit [Coxiellaceae bacterium]
MKRILKLSLITLLAFWLAACDSDKQPKPQAVPVGVEKIVKSNLPITLDYIGITRSVAGVDVVARVQGFLEQMLFTEGDYVKKGTLLYVIDPRPFRAELDSAKANLDKAIANMLYQKVEVQRKAKLVVENYVSQEEFDNQKALYQEALAQVEVDKASVQTAQINLSYCYMYSPVSGIAGNRKVDVGNLVGTNQDETLVSVVKLDPMFVQFSPSVEDFGQVIKYHNNMPFTVNVNIPDFPKMNFTGKVDMIDNEADQNTSTILMRAAISNPKKLLRPGIYVNVSIVLAPKETVIKIPATAVVNMQGVNYVFLADSTHKAQLTKVTISKMTSSYAVVDKGLKVDDILITSNLQKLRSNIPVSYKIKASA